MESLRAKLIDIRRLLERAEALELSNGAVRRLRWFEFALMHHGNVSLTCRHFGIARTTFLRWALRFDPANPETIEEKSRRPFRVRQPQTDSRAVGLIRELRTEHLTLGKEHIQKLLQEKHGITLSVSTVGRVIARHKFFFGESASHQTKRETELETPSLQPKPRAKPSAESESASTSLPFPATDPGLEPS